MINESIHFYIFNLNTLISSYLGLHDFEILCISYVLGFKMQTRPYLMRSLSRKNPTTIHFHFSQLNVSQTNELFLFFRLKYCYTFNVYVITVLYGVINLYATLLNFEIRPGMQIKQTIHNVSSESNS